MEDKEQGNGSTLRMPWSRSDRRVPRMVLRPLQGFLETEVSGGVLLLAATVCALVWANIGDSYERLWETMVSLDLGGWGIRLSIRDLVSEGLMTLFFFVAGLEIKRELTTGELREHRVAALPIVAAVGGMAMPALIYTAVNAGGPGAAGWGVPMATDLAFALGVITVAGRRRLPLGLRTFLLALAIVDDVGTVVVISVFYSHAVRGAPLLTAAALLVVMMLLNRNHVRWIPIYVALGSVVWFAVFRSGVHASLAGAVLGLLAPSKPFQRPAAVSEEAHRTADETVDDPWPPDADAHQWLRLAELSREAVSPVARLERALHPWTSFLIVPLFALAAAGVSLSTDSLGQAFRSRVTWGIIAGLLVGKAVGITGGAFLAVRAGIARLPAGVRWSHLFAVATAAGVGLVVSLFVADIAFHDPAALEEAKIGILAGSVAAAASGALLLRAGRR